jgi:uncharacterized protein (DUF952 family)
MTDQIAYKVFTDPEFESFTRDGIFVGSPADIADGFIHLSTSAQLEVTLARHYQGQTDIVLAAINLLLLGAAVRWEESRGGQVFPHLYGNLPVAAVTAYSPVVRQADGALKLPV